MFIFFLSKGGLGHYYSFWLKFNLFFSFSDHNWSFASFHMSSKTLFWQITTFYFMIHFRYDCVKLFEFIVFICVQYDKFCNSSKNQKFILHYIYIYLQYFSNFVCFYQKCNHFLMHMASQYFFLFMTESLIFPPF